MVGARRRRAVDVQRQRGADEHVPRKPRDTFQATERSGMVRADPVRMVPRAARGSRVLLSRQLRHRRPIWPPATAAALSPGTENQFETLSEFRVQCFCYGRLRRWSDSSKLAQFFPELFPWQYPVSRWDRQTRRPALRRGL